MLTGVSSKIGHHHRIPVLQVDPFEREQSNLPDKRLLAIIDSHLAIFGTVSSVEQEIDRYLTAAAPDPFMIRGWNCCEARMKPGV